MLWFLFCVYVGVCLAMMASAIWRKEDRLQFPFLAGGTVLLMVCVPLSGLMLDHTGPSTSSLERFTTMAILCQLMAWAGYVFPWKFKERLLYRFDSRSLAASAVILSFFGFYFGYQLSNIEPETAANGNWTGIATIFVTLSQVSRYGFVLAAIVFFRDRYWSMLLAAIPQIIIYVSQFLGGRRSPTGEFLIIVVTLILFYRKKSLPLWLLLAGMASVAVFSYNIGAIRANVDQTFGERIDSFTSSDPLSALTDEGMVENKGYIEIANAVNFMEAKAIGGNYTYGLHFWNQLVFGFVPAQFVGVETKAALQFDLADDNILTGFEKSNGTCESGIAEAFMAFGYFGCLLFFIMGAGFRWLWHESMRGNVLCQFVLMLNILPGIMSFSIQLWTMLNGLVNILIFAGPFLWWSSTSLHGWRLRNVERRLGATPKS